MAQEERMPIKLGPIAGRELWLTAGNKCLCRYHRTLHPTSPQCLPPTTCCDNRTPCTLSRSGLVACTHQFSSYCFRPVHFTNSKISLVMHEHRAKTVTSLPQIPELDQESRRRAGKEGKGWEGVGREGKRKEGWEGRKKQKDAQTLHQSATPIWKF